MESCRCLKEHPDTQDVPIILLSEYNDPAKRVAALEAGGVDYLDKPFYPEELVTRAKTRIETHRLRLEILSQIAEQKALLQVLCHDLVNPVFAAHSLLSPRLKNGDLDRSLANSVMNCCSSALEVIKPVKEEHHLVSRKSQAQAENVRVKDALEDSAKTLKPIFKAKNINLLVEVDSELNVQISRVVLVHNYHQQSSDERSQILQPRKRRSSPRLFKRIGKADTLLHQSGRQRYKLGRGHRLRHASRKTVRRAHPWNHRSPIHRSK